METQFVIGRLIERDFVVIGERDVLILGFCLMNMCRRSCGLKLNWV
jgi:hypothetical protein